MKKTILWILIVIFVVFALVQYNDPDPYIWAPAYLLTAYLCYYKWKNGGDKMLYFAIGLLYLLWGMNQFPPQWEGVLLSQGMKTLNIELGRESLGLGCCTIAMWICGVLK